MAQYLTGIEMSPNRLACGQVTLSKQPVVTAWSIARKSIPMSRSAVSAEASSQLEDLLKNTVTGSFKRAPVTIVIPEAYIFRKLIEVPAETAEDELLTAIRAEIESFVPGDIADMQVDYQVIPQSAFVKPDPHLQYVTAVAVERSLVESIIQVAKAAKLHIHAIDTRSAAVVRAVMPPNQKDPAFLLEITKEKIDIAIVYQGVVWANTEVNREGTTAEQIENVLDEMSYAEKFFTNRTGRTQAVSDVRCINGCDNVDDFWTELKKKSGKAVVAAELAIPFQDECVSDSVGAVGAALYNHYEAIAS